MADPDNTWFSMWLKPKQSIKTITTTNPRQGFFFLAAVWFLHFFFLYESYYGVIFPSHWIIATIVAVILSPFLGSICFYIFGWFLFKTGKLLQGKGSKENIRCAFVWSRLPLIIDLFMWGFFAVFSREIVMQPVIGISFIFINLIAFITFIWAFILLIAALKEVQKFSLAKSIMNVILAYFIVIVIFFILILIYLFIFF